MKLVRSVVTWRMVSVWATSPRITSWSATIPGSRTEWIGTSPSISRAVRAAVPDGASSLRRVVVLDDLRRRHVPRGLGREAHHQHGADREVRRGEHVAAGAGDGLAQRGLVPAGGADHDVDARARGQRGVGHRLVGEREVDDHVRAVEHGLQRRAERRVGPPGELEVVRALDRLAHRRAPCAPRRRPRRRGSCRQGLARHALDRRAEGVLVRADARPPTAHPAATAPPRAPRMSSSDTASMRAITSSVSSSGRPNSSEPPSRCMREPVDSMPSTMRALTFSRARTSSSSVAGCSRRRPSSSRTTAMASLRFSGRVPT